MSLVPCHESVQFSIESLAHFLVAAVFLRIVAVDLAHDVGREQREAVQQDRLPGASLLCNSLGDIPWSLDRAPMGRAAGAVGGDPSPHCCVARLCGCYTY